jgi:hypothetical protein
MLLTMEFTPEVSEMGKRHVIINNADGETKNAQCNLHDREMYFKVVHLVEKSSKNTIIYNNIIQIPIRADDETYLQVTCK